MKITVFNSKGGVGKTALALNLALTYNYNILSNDRMSVVSDVISERKFLLLDQQTSFGLARKALSLTKNFRLIFDLGGFMDSRILSFFEMCDTILIPLLTHKENLKGHLDLIEEVINKSLSAETILIINQSRGNNHIPVSNLLNYHFPLLKTFHISYSAVFRHMIEQKKSIKKIAEESPFHRRFFEPVARQFETLNNYINSKNERF